MAGQHARSGCGLAPSNFRSYHDGAWRPSDEQAFLATTLQTPALDKQAKETTVFYVHGLAVTAEEALNEGWMVYRALAQRTPADVPIRFVLYSWPSDLHRRPLRSARDNQRHTDFEGARLAGLLSKLNRSHPRSPVSLVAHSSGCRVASAALESIAVKGPPISGSLRAVLIAAAVDDGGLLPGRSYSRAILQVERMLILFNPGDRVLRWYRLLERGHRGPEALGYTSLAERYLSSADRAKIRQVNSSPYVGQQHYIGAYTSSAWLMAQVQAFCVAPPLNNQR